MKLDKQFLWFLCAINVFYWGFRLAEVPGRMASLLVIPILFGAWSLIKAVLSVLNKDGLSLNHIFLSLLYVMVGLKLNYLYYNVFLHLFITLCYLVLINRKKNKLTVIGTMCCLLLIVPDTIIFKKTQCYDDIIWGNKITWDNFKGVRPKEKLNQAAVQSVFFYKINKTYSWPQTISITVMNDKCSFVVHGELNNPDWVLAHEQLHFDITEWHRREMQDSIDSKLLRTNEEIENIIGHFHFLKRERQKEYDSTSNHSLDSLGQEKWNLLVKKKLDAL